LAIPDGSVPAGKILPSIVIRSPRAPGGCFGSAWFTTKCRRVESDVDGERLLAVFIEKIRLQDQPAKVLEALLRPGELLTREELRHNAINRLRDALSDSAENPFFIETVPKRGYRFIASIRFENAVDAPVGSPRPVSDILTEPDGSQNQNLRSGETSIQSAAQRIARFITSHKKIAISIIAVAVPTAACSALYPPVEARPIDSIAVLPLANLVHGDRDDYLADGMTEELITELAKMDSFHVISRTSVMRYKETIEPCPRSP
jgi:DNA-binding winged helix-turn-helix (wHTH) protein